MSSQFRPYLKGQTIAAIATPPGEGGIAIIRISGDLALGVADQLLSKKVSSLPSHTLHFGHILDKEKNRIDSCLICVMKAPKSYTGEDTVEIHCHGGSLITKKVLERVFEAGALPANPGEFTFRAYLNQKIDLAQAEAVQALIGAKNELALQAAEKQLQGDLSQGIRQLQKELLDIAAILEAWVDFPEEGLEFASQEEILVALQATLFKIENLEKTFEIGKIAHEGLSLCLVGLPNVGKSSLMNALLKKERAIVTPIAGTTRDVIEDDLRINAFHFKVIDTAGIRNTEEIIEKEGIKKSYQALQEADLILLVLDLCHGLREEEKKLLSLCPSHKTLLIWNKCDIGEKKEGVEGYQEVLLSAKHKEGMQTLYSTIEAFVQAGKPFSKEELIITSERHKTALHQAALALKKVIYGLEEGVSAEFVSSDMRYALKELSSILGMDITEDLLTAIFSKFCVGK